VYWGKGIGQRVLGKGYQRKGLGKVHGGKAILKDISRALSRERNIKADKIQGKASQAHEKKPPTALQKIPDISLVSGFSAISSIYIRVGICASTLYLHGSQLPCRGGSSLVVLFSCSGFLLLKNNPRNFFFRIGVSKWKKAKRALEQWKRLYDCCRKDLTRICLENLRPKSATPIMKHYTASNHRGEV
jgi:hypothetical protein